MSTYYRWHDDHLERVEILVANREFDGERWAFVEWPDSHRTVEGSRPAFPAGPVNVLRPNGWVLMSRLETHNDADLCVYTVRDHIGLKSREKAS